MTRTLKLATAGILAALLAACDTPPPDPELMQDEAQLQDLRDRRDHVR